MNEIKSGPNGELADASTAQPVVLDVIEEQLLVTTHVVEDGTVRLHKHVHEDIVHLDIPLTTQTVTVERVPVGRDVDTPVEVRWEGDVMVVPVVAERLVWRKQLVLVEELRVTRASHMVRDVRDVPLRREDVVVERVGSATADVPAL